MHRISVRKATPHNGRGDAPQESLRELKWSSHASPALREAAKANDATAFCRAWLAETLPASSALKKLTPGLSVWSLPPAFAEETFSTLVHAVFPSAVGRPSGGSRSAIKADRPVTKHLDALVAHLAQRPHPWSAVESVMAGEILLTWGRQLSPSQLWSLWSRLAAASLQPADRPKDESPDEWLLREGEALFLAGGLLEPLREAKRVREQGRRVLIQELMSRTDRDGTPHAELLSRLPRWLAPLVRASLWAERLQVPLWSPEHRQRLSLVLERSIPLCRPSGQLAFSNGASRPVLPLFQAASQVLELTGPADGLLRMLQQGGQPPARKRRLTADVQSMPSVQSDWARFALLRSDWSAHADSLVISHHQSLPSLDVAALGQSVLHGLWGLDIQIGDAGIELAPEWLCSCWMSDPDADYLELQMQGPGGLRVERQILLSRQDHFLLLADCVRGARSVKEADSEPLIHLQSRLPLAANVIVDADCPTREIRLKSGKQPVRVFPLSLPDDRVLSTPHQFFCKDQELVLQHKGQGNGLYAPLLFDWHPARIRKPALWRTLTVTEAGKVVGRDIAAGHRLQLGKFQLLIYRSLAEGKTARAVLGHHTFRESVIGRFDAEGDIETIMHVDA